LKLIQPIFEDQACPKKLSDTEAETLVEGIKLKKKNKEIRKNLKLIFIFIFKLYNYKK
jgi:hypothetical protein